MQIVESYTVDLAKINGKGDIKCPKCGIKISPHDKTESVYTILEIVMNGENLDRIVLKCSNCESHILLTGFHALSNAK
jgi:hypothetical protein